MDEIRCEMERMERVSRERGVLAAQMALREINVLFCATSEKETMYVIEYKWWYGPGPNDSRWQRVCVSCPSHLEESIYKCLIDRVEKIREALADETGVSQDVRH